jgi:hypothetical protein
MKDQSKGLESQLKQLITGGKAEVVKGFDFLDYGKKDDEDEQDYG